MKHRISHLLLCICFLPLLGQAQFGGLQVGQTSGDSVHHVVNNWFNAVSVPVDAGSNTGFKDLDVNGDGTDDLRVFLDVWGVDTDSLFASLAGLNGAQIRGLSQSHFTDSLLLSDILDSNQNWIDTQNHPSGKIPLYDLYRGNLSSINDINSGWKYFAIRFPVAGDWFYAWFRYEVNGYSTHDGHVLIPEYVWKGDASVVDVDPALLSGEVELYPNPGKGALYMHLPEGFGGKVELDVLDARGKIAYHNTVTATGAQNGYLELPLGDLESGVYHLRIRTKRGTLYKKIVRM